ncbi:GTP cyclohydrolase FolE2 [Salinicola aestuarinus]|uniref:GTP cyclohydrolase FolE2 n=1 Tax=Salinicola aestuarinus TaxID=1949082 RepID=UPI000DA17DF6|nr:GTP cyclohydrolase FolE2 [Salinicola aestuarinus]
MTPLSALPDVAIQRDDHSHGPRALQRVGMQGIACRIQLAGGTRLNAYADVGVDLAAGHRGIHMSRLYRLIDALEDTPLDADTWSALGEALLASQGEISQRLHLTLHAELPLRRQALLSEASGWRHYPITLGLSGERGALHTTLGIALTYSSTCPCSTALARHAMARKWREWAQDNPQASADPESVAEWIERTGYFPTPHSQRSRADVSLRLSATAPFDLASRIDAFEQCLETPVQTLVKRADEQAFAERNGNNPMFCEDAARRLAQHCDTLADVVGYRIDIEHAESLHAHDAVARAEWNFVED